MKKKQRRLQQKSTKLKAVLRGRFIAIPEYLKKQEKSQINNLNLHLKQLENEEMMNSRVNRRKEIIKIRAEINSKETKETIAQINKATSWFFEKIIKIEKPLARLIKAKGRKSSQQNQKLKWRNHNRHHRNTKDDKRLLSATICQ